MYIICGGMPRSCSTWQYQVACDLVERHLGGQRLGYVETGAELAGRLSAPAPEGWHVVKTHDSHESIAGLLAGGQALGLYSYRDLRDVAYSLVHKLCTPFEQVVLRSRLLHRCLATDAFWASQPGVLCQRYEDLMADPAGGVRAIAAHLGLAPDAAECAAVAERYSLDANKARAARLAQRLRGAGVELGTHTHALVNDPHELLHWNHIRAGEVGAWRAQATPRDLLVLGLICTPWLMARGYEPDGAWAMPGLEHVAELDAELLRTQARLAELEVLGPEALGLARWAHAASKRFPRLRGLLKRFLRRGAAGREEKEQKRGRGRPGRAREAKRANPSAGAARTVCAWDLAGDDLDFPTKTTSPPPVARAVAAAGAGRAGGAHFLASLAALVSHSLYNASKLACFCLAFLLTDWRNFHSSASILPSANSISRSHLASLASILPSLRTLLSMAPKNSLLKAGLTSSFLALALFCAWLRSSIRNFTSLSSIFLSAHSSFLSTFTSASSIVPSARMAAMATFLQSAM
jgi:hypothetical protein